MSRSPECIIIRKEDRQARLATIEADEYDRDRSAALAALHAFGRGHGYQEAKALAAAFAHSKPLEVATASHAEAAERLFKGGCNAA